MILVDANLLLFAYDTGSRQHGPARAWLEQVLSGDEPVALAWTTVLAFLRIGSDTRVFAAPLAPGDALAAVAGWLGERQVSILDPGERHLTLLAELIESSGARGPLVMDAHLAALALENGAVLCTDDDDFTRFPGLKLRYPLRPKR